MSFKALCMVSQQLQHLLKLFALTLGYLHQGLQGCIFIIFPIWKMGFQTVLCCKVTARHSTLIQIPASNLLFTGGLLAASPERHSFLKVAQRITKTILPIWTLRRAIVVTWHGDSRGCDEKW